ncbi:hypothetical protein CRUP_014488, partial [Coryphaenoides rupestris]
CVLQHPASSSSPPAPQGVPVTQGCSVAFVSPPGALADSAVVRVRSRCTRPCRLTLELLVSTSSSSAHEAPLLVFQKSWTTDRRRGDRHRRHPPPGSARTYRTRLRLPPSLAFRRGFFNRHVIDARSGVLHAWLTGLNDSSTGDSYGSYQGSAARAAAELRVVPPSQRPARPPTGCPSWSAELLWTRTIAAHQCPQGAGAEAVHLLRFPAASTGERFGVVRTFHRFAAGGDLASQRLQAVTQPRVTVSVWVYLLEWCRSKLCGLLLHVNRQQEFDSMLMLLTDTGEVVIQARLTSGEDRSFHAHASLPLLTWIRLDCFVHRGEVKLETTWKNQSRTHTYSFPTSIRHDDTDGYFVIGGSRYMPGIYGYFGPIVFHRLGATRVDNPLSPGNLPEKLNRAHRSCRRIRVFARAFSRAVTLGDPFSTKDLGVGNAARAHNFIPLHAAAAAAEEEEDDSPSGPCGPKALGDHLFEYVAQRMFGVDYTQARLSARLGDLLHASCCLGNQHAPLLLATVHLAGLGHPADQEQGHVYSLMGALADHRLALMHLGYKHSQGLDGFPRDLEVAYSCYANSAMQTVSDNDAPHEERHVYLSNKEHLKLVDDGQRDVLHFLKLKAESGDVASQKELASMYFWGQNGVSKDVASGVRWYRKVALRMTDARAVYDYAILLMKGQGVKKNLTESVRLLEKAINMVRVRGGAERHGLVLLFRGEERQRGAFLCFRNASRLGHAGATVGMAWYLVTGTLGGVARDVELAVRKLKNVSERNGHLGYTLRTALRAYLGGSWAEALLGYMLAAETGLGLAQTNSAHLCQELKFTPECQWRYTNYSVLNYDPHPSVLLKMGDYYYHSSAHGGEDSLSLIGQAVSMYSRAAAAGSPQGFFSLVTVAQEGHDLPPSVRRRFNVSAHERLDVLLEKILQRCVQMEAEGSITPCTLALLRFWLDRAWRTMVQDPAKICLTYAALVSLIAVAVVMPTQAILEGCVRPLSSSSSEGRRRGLWGHTGPPAPEGPPNPEPTGTRIDRTRTAPWLGGSGDIQNCH